RLPFSGSNDIHAPSKHDYSLFYRAKQGHEEHLAAAAEQGPSEGPSCASTAINAPFKLARYRPVVVRPGRSSIARVERAPSERARSASRRTTRPCYHPPYLHPSPLVP